MSEASESRVTGSAAASRRRDVSPVSGRQARSERRPGGPPIRPSAEHGRDARDTAHATTRALPTVIVGVAALAFAFPLLHLLGRSVRVGEGASLAAYVAVLADLDFYRATANSLLLASAASLVSTTLAAMAGYALAFLPFRGRSAYVAGLVALAALPGQLLLPGGYEVIASLGLFDTRLAVLLPATVSVLGALLFRAAFSGVPGDLLAAARIDGCSEVAAWWHVAMPAVRPTTAACLCLAFAGTYNAVVWPAVVLQSPGLETLPLRLAIASGTALTAADQARVTAATVLGLVPLLAVFVLLQREFLPTLRGSVKG